MFDVLGDRPYTLADHLHCLGITPIPMQQLEDHKAEQVRRHPPHILARNWPFLVMFVSVTLAFGVALNWMGGDMLYRFGTALVVMTVSVLCGGFSTIAIGAVLLTICNPIRGFARWEERHPYLAELPKPIRNVALRIRQHYPTAKFIIGDLMQDEVYLDPYLVVMINGEKACLGIWDDETIIACAEMT